MSAPSAVVPDAVRVHPTGSLTGTVLVAGDKSIGHRALLIGALAEGPVAVAGVPDGADVLASAAALRALGVRVELEPDGSGRLIGQVHAPLRRGPDSEAVAIDCGNSGTTLRLLAGIAAGAGRHVLLDGDDSLRRRPVDRIVDPLVAMGAVASAREGRLPPLGLRSEGLVGVDWDSPVASAQVKSAVLLAGLAAGIAVGVRSPHPSRDHTERMLRHGGVDVTTTGGPHGAEHVSLTPGPLRLDALEVPRDPSAAAFWHVAAASGAGTVTTPGIALNPGRTGALDVLRGLGAHLDVRDEQIRCGEPVGTVEVGPAALSGGEVSGGMVVRCLDELPILALAGARSDGGLRVRDAGELRVKESDRIAALSTTFAALGLELVEHPDGFDVPGGQRPSGGRIDAGGDHRIAMTAAVAATFATGPVDIDGFGSVATSYPGFLADLVALGGAVEVRDA